MVAVGAVSQTEGRATVQVAFRSPNGRLDTRHLALGGNASGRSRLATVLFDELRRKIQKWKAEG